MSEAEALEYWIVCVSLSVSVCSCVNSPQEAVTWAGVGMTHSER